MAEIKEKVIVHKHASSELLGNQLFTDIVNIDPLSGENVNLNEGEIIVVNDPNHTGIILNDTKGRPVFLENSYLTEVSSFKSNIDGTEIDKSKRDDKEVTFHKKDGKEVKWDAKHLHNLKETSTKQFIPVAGGPLAEQCAKLYPDGIAPGTDMEDILMDLFCKEIMPTGVYVTKGELSSWFNAPSVSFKKEGYPDSAEIVEVGTKLTIGEFRGYFPEKRETSRKYYGFEFGYSENPGVAEKKDIIQGNPPEVPVSNVKLNTGTFQLVEEIHLGKKILPNESQSGINDKNISIPENVQYAGEGDNIVKFTIYGPGYSGTVAKSPKYYVASNLNRTYSERKNWMDAQESESGGTINIFIKEQIEQKLSIAIAEEGKSSVSVIGAYPFFSNGVKATGNDKVDFESEKLKDPVQATKIGLMKKKQEVFAVSFAMQDKAGYTLWLPKDRNMSEFSIFALNPLTKSYDAKVDPAKFIESGIEEMTIQGKQVEYKKFVWKETEGPNCVKFLIKK